MNIKLLRRLEYLKAENFTMFEPYIFTNIYILRHIGLLEVDEDKIRKIRPKGTQVRMLYVPREAIRP